MMEPTASQLGYLGVSTECKNILQGRYNPKANTREEMTLFLQNLKNQVPHKPFQPITKEEYQAGWKACKEKTSAGGTITHFGHCKAMAEDKELSEMEAAFISIPLKSGFPYSTWKQGIDCVLPKKQGLLEADKLRTIVLFEAEFNFMNKIIARRAMRNAEEAQALINEQYGSRKDHTAIEQVLNKRLSFDLMRQMKRPGTIVPTDLKGCYDRIVHSVASLCLQRVGIKEPEVVCMFSALQEMEHLIRSAYGTSQTGYNNDLWVVPIQGICQGHGAGPAIWALVSTPILKIMKKQGCGTFFKASISGHEIRLVGYAFVDDTDLIQTGLDSNEDIHEIIGRTQKSLDL